MSRTLRAASPEEDLALAPELVPLVRLLTRAEGFALAFLECNVPVAAKRIVGELIAALETRGRRGRRLRLDESEEDLLGRLRGLDPPATPGEGLFVLGFERAIPSRVEFPPALTRLNRAREQFRELAFPLVLVLPRYALDQLSRQAPDFWAWRSGVFEVRVEEPHLEQMLQDVTQPSSGAYESLSATRKQEHLEVLRGLLAELEAQADGNERARGELHQRIARLLDAMGRWSEAEAAAVKALELAQEAGDRRNVAAASHHLGVVAQRRGLYEEAIEWYRKSLAIKEELGDRAGIATSYHQLGILAEQRGSYEEAIERYRKSLAIREELGNRVDMATSYHQMGNVAYLRGSYEEALEWYRKSLAIREQLGDRAGMASTYHQLGMVAQQRGSYDEALEQYRKSLMIDEELGDRAGMADSYGQISLVFADLDKPEEALPYGLRCLALNLELQTPNTTLTLRTLTRLRDLLGEDRFRRLASEHLDADGVARVVDLLDRFAAEGSEPAKPGSPRADTFT